MADTAFPLKLLPFTPEQTNYISKSTGGKRNFPQRDRQAHGQRIQNRFNAVFQNREDAQVAAFRAKGGMYVQFRGLASHELATNSLENLPKKIRLLNISQSSDADQNKTTVATVFVPAGEEAYFVNKVNDYLNSDTASGNPKNQNLINGIEELSDAVIEALWTDKPELLPEDDERWCEVWLRSNGDTEAILEAFNATCEELEIAVGQGMLEFPERIVVPVLANREKLQKLLDHSGLLAEIRLLAETAHYWLELENKDQADWVADLLGRTVVDEETKVSVLILDTGINRGHPLLEQIINEDDLFTVDADWGLADHDKHGTLMAGTVSYGDMLELLNHDDLPIAIGLKVESGKILPPEGENDRKLYGYFTSQLISQAELRNQEQFRIVCMAVSTNDEYDGRPSSWSGAVDAIASGADDKNKRLIILSAGNVHIDADYHYYDSNLASRIESPGQSWNAITVGALTRKTQIKDPTLDDYSPVADHGGISPFSKTSMLWDPKWPIKPEVVFEGGNSAKMNNEPFYTTPDDLSLISTNYQLDQNQFAVFNMTSASTALASNMAAKIAYNYPEFWEETVRGLMIHSADWTPTMRRKFLGANPSRQDYLNLLRACGYGEPNLTKAISCATNSMTMIMQHQLQPFQKTGKEENYKRKTKDMHFHELPWPKDMLLELGDVPVILRITLSYFIEPGPGEIGWKDRYRYPSHGLRFDINNPQETPQQFRQRINKLAEQEEDKFTNDSARWTIGKNRDRGSIHSDIIETTAAQIATCDLIAIYPTIGWWRERPHLNKCNNTCRYSLAVSLETPDEETDIYTAISTEIQNRIELAISA